MTPALKAEDEEEFSYVFSNVKTFTFVPKVSGSIVLYVDTVNSGGTGAEVGNITIQKTGDAVPTDIWIRTAKPSGNGPAFGPHVTMSIDIEENATYTITSGKYIALYGLYITE